MKRLFFLPLLACFFFTGCSEEPHTTHSEKYSTLAKPMTIQPMPEVIEVFSLSCGHCRQMENEIPKIASLIEKSIDQEHVTFNESATFAAIIYYTAMIQTDNNPPEALKKALFTFVQEDQKDTVEDNKVALTKLFQDFNLISPYDLTDEQQNILFEAMNKANEITVQSEITSVPTFIVNGQYVVNTAAHKSAEDLAETINQLMTKDKKQR